MSERRKYHRYTEEERTEIRRMYKEEGKSPREISQSLCLPLSTVEYYVYVKSEPKAVIKYPKRCSNGIIETEVTDPMPRKISGEDLKRENRDLREENEYLKDKVAYLEALYETSMQEKVKDNSFTPESMLLSLRNQKCKVFDDRVITCEFVRNANLISKMLKYNVPIEIPIKS